MTDKDVDLASLFGGADSSTFLGIEPCEDPASIDASSAFIGVPCATPYRNVGPYARNGPSSIREAGAAWSANIGHHNFDVGGAIFPEGFRRAVDCGDVPWDETDFVSNRAAVRHIVSQVVTAAAVPVVVGGDDSIPIPMLDAMADTGRRYTVVQIDAHIDWRDEYEGERFGLSSNMRRASEMDHISTIIQVGARGLGSARASDVQDALDWGVHFFPAEQIAAGGVEQALHRIDPATDVIVCVDIDGLDPSIVPNTIGRAPGGLTYWDSLQLIRGCAAASRIAAIDFAEIYPENDIDGQGGITVSRLIAASMGIIARQEIA